MLATYKPSGRFNNSYLTLMPVAIAIGLALGIVYQLGVHYIGSVKLNVALWIGTGAAAGGIAGLAMRLSKCRNRLLAALMGAVVGLAAVIAGHVLEYWLIGKLVPIDLDLDKYIDLRKAVGWTWTSRGSSSSTAKPSIDGNGVWVVWAIEAVGLILTGAITAALMVAKPFCEKCERWASSPLAVFVVPWVSPAGVERAKEAHTIEELLSISPEPSNPPLPEPTNKPTDAAPAPPPGTTITRLVYTLMGCPGCDDVAILTVEAKTSKQVKKKHLAETNTVVRRNLVIDKEARAKVLAASAAWTGVTA